MATYTFQIWCKAIEQRQRVKRSWKDSEGVPQFEYEDLGWFLISNTGMAFGFPFKPEIEPESWVEVTIGPLAPAGAKPPTRL